MTQTSRRTATALTLTLALVLVASPAAPAAAQALRSPNAHAPPPTSRAPLPSAPREMRTEFGGTIGENFDFYWQRSPLAHAPRVGPVVGARPVWRCGRLPCRRTAAGSEARADV